MLSHTMHVTGIRKIMLTNAIDSRSYTDGLLRIRFEENINIYQNNFRCGGHLKLQHHHQPISHPPALLSAVSEEPGHEHKPTCE